MVIPYAYDDVEVLGLPLVPVTALLCNPIPGPTSVVLCAPEFTLAPAGLDVAAPPALSGVAVLLVPAAVDVVP